MQRGELVSKTLLFLAKYAFSIDLKLLLKLFDGSIKFFNSGYFKRGLGILF